MKKSKISNNKANLVNSLLATKFPNRGSAEMPNICSMDPCCDGGSECTMDICNAPF